MSGLLLASAAAVVIMAAVGYLLARMAEPDSEQAAIDDETTSSADTDTTPYQQSDEQLIEEINRRLPQTQCAQCGHPGCRPYAEAIIKHDSPVNQCPPGGEALIEELAALLGVDALPLDNDKGQTKPAQVAVIVEADCIGCALCLAACPVDAIVGASRYMHTVIAEQCTGCELCLPPCPVDCIELHPLEKTLHRWQWPKPI